MERKIIKARKHTVEDVRKVLKELDKKANTNYASLPIKVSARMTKALGGAVCRITRYRMRQKVEALEFKFSRFFLDAYLSESEFESIVAHEFLHLYTNVKYQENCNHDKRYKTECTKLGYGHMGGYTCSEAVGMAFTEAIHSYKTKKLGDNPLNLKEVIC